MEGRPFVAHFDGDSFFVSCELLRRPDLRGKPVVTGGERGVVTSMSLEAKRLGVRRTTPCFEVRKTHPNVIILESSFELYAATARRVFSIVGEYAMALEEYSIDECFALVASPEVARKAKQELEDSTGVTFGVGVARTKTLAKVASRLAKPAGFRALIDDEDVRGVLTEFPIEAVWGIGPRTSAALRARGIATAAELAQARGIEERFSVNVARTARELSGRFELPLVEDASTKFMESYATPGTPQASVTSSRSFHPPVSNVDELRCRVREHVDAACARVRAMGKAARRVDIFLRDESYRTVSAHARIEPASASPIGCIDAARRALAAALSPGNSYRTVGVTFTEFVERGVHQEDLFSNGERAGVGLAARREAVADAVDALRHRLGPDAIRFGSVGGKAQSNTPRPWALPHLGEVR